MGNVLPIQTASNPYQTPAGQKLDFKVDVDKERAKAAAADAKKPEQRKRKEMENEVVKA